MDRFTTYTGIAAPLIIPNVTTDAISPSKANLSASQDLGELLFADWRYELDGTEKPDFVLNCEPFRRASILVGGPNFGCGSSRERAVWALQSFGIHTVLATSFGDIFRTNCLQNGVLPVQLPEDAFRVVRDYVERASPPLLTVDLDASHVRLGTGEVIPFAIEDDRREALLEGLDEIDVLLRLVPAIDHFERDDRARRPWIYGAN